METTPYRTHSYRWINLVILGILGFTLAFALGGPTVLVDSVSKHWGVSFTQATLALVLLSGLASTLLGVPAGIASNKWGYKLPLVIGASVASAGLLLRGAATTWTAFLATNAVIAIGIGFTMSGGGTLIRKWFPNQEVGQANGWSILLNPLGAGIGMLAAFPLIESAGWPRMWLVMGVGYALATILGWFFLRENPPSPPAPAPPMPTEFKTGFLQEAKQVMNRTNVVLQLALYAAMGLIIMAPALLPVVFGARQVPTNTIGIVISMFNLIAIPAMLLIPGWSLRKGRAKISISAGLLAAGLGFIGIFYLPPISAYVTLSAALVIFSGIAIGAVIPTTLSIIMLQPGVHPWNVGIVTGVSMTVMGVGRLVTPLVAGALVDRGGVTTAAWVLTIMLVIAGVIVYKNL